MHDCFNLRDSLLSFYLSLQRDLQPSLKQKLKEMEAQGLELPGERDVRERGQQPKPPTLTRHPTTIIEVGDKTSKKEFTGFAMDTSDIRNLMMRPIRLAVKTVKRIR